jgi:C4-dicarboxylate transporter, DctQ subunit
LPVRLTKVLSKLENIFDSLIDILAFVSGVIFIFITGSVCVDVIMRYFFNRPMIWVIEISEYLLVYMTFLAAAWVLKREGHVTVDVVTAQLKPKAQAITGIISSTVGVFVCLVIAWFGFLETLDNFLRGVRIPSILEFPKGPILAIIPLGSFLFMIQFIRRVIGYISDLDQTKDRTKRG